LGLKVYNQIEFGDMAIPESLVAKRTSRFYNPILRMAEVSEENFNKYYLL
jgi:hypothetical protein